MKKLALVALSALFVTGSIFAAEMKGDMMEKKDTMMEKKDAMMEKKDDMMIKKDEMKGDMKEMKDVLLQGVHRLNQ